MYLNLIFGRWQSITIIVILILCLLAYSFLAQKILGRNVKFMFIPITMLAFIMLLMKLPLIRIFQLFILTLPLDATLVMEVGFRVQTAYLMLLFLLFIMLLSREVWHTKSPLDYAIVAYLLIASLSLMQSIISPPPELKLSAEMGFRTSSFRSLIQLALLIFLSLIYFVTVHICNDKKHLDIAIKTYIVIGGIIAFYGIYQAFASQFNLPLKDVTNALRTGGKGYGSLFTAMELGRFRSQATFGEPLGFGHYLLSLLPFTLAFGAITRSYIDLEKRQWMTGRVLALVITLFFFAMFMTRSRGALIGLGASIMILILLLGMQNLRSFFIYILIAFLILTAFYLIAIRYFGFSKDILQLLRFSKQLPSKNIEPDTPIEVLMRPGTQRYLFYFSWVPTLFKENPVLGVGIGNFTLIISSILRSQEVLISPTGVWGTVVAETGILGIVTFSSIILLYYVVMIKAIIKNRNTHWEPYLVGLTACFTGIMVQYISFGSRLGVYTWFLMGISMAIVNHIRREAEEGLFNNVIRT